MSGTDRPADRTGIAVALDLLEFSLLMRAERHRREHPDATEEEVAAVFTPGRLIARGHHTATPKVVQWCGRD